MKNEFIKTHNFFSWDNLGDIEKGRGNLGQEMPVLVYRLMQYTMLDTLSNLYGSEKANDIFRQSGFLAGFQYAKNLLNLNVDLKTFFSDLQKSLKEMKICILRIESFDEATGDIMLTAGEDLDCSGIPITNETVCYYDEGFISGILEAYTKKKYDVREIDCWANGNRTCRFQGKIVL